MTEEQQCYYIVRDDGSATFYLHGGNGAHLVLADTLDASAQLAERDAEIEQLRAQVADLWNQLAERDATVASLVERVNKCTDDFGNVTG